MPSLIVFNSVVFLGAVKQRCIRCQQDEGIAALTERAAQSKEGKEGGTKWWRFARGKGRECPCEWLSDTCRHADMSAVAFRMSSWNDQGPVCVGHPPTL